MAPRAYWKGYLKLSLVSCPVALFPASSEREKISFHQINKKTGNRIKYRKVDAETGDEVDSADIIKGYQVGKGEYIEVEPEELEAIAIESKRTIEIDEFVPKKEIDELYLNSPYYIVPDGEVGQQAFAVIREAIRTEGMSAPSQDLLVIRRNHKTGEVSLDPLRWGLIPYWCSDPKGGRNPINAKCESVRDLPTFRDAYGMRRCIVPVDGFFEWKAIKGQKAKQPYAIAMKDGAPFGLAGIWENWKEPASGEWIRTFAIITTDANELVADIHDRMPVILAPGDYARWLGEEGDPRDLMRPFPAAPMRIWPISTRVNKPENDDAAIVEPVEAATDAA